MKQIDMLGSEYISSTTIGKDPNKVLTYKAIKPNSIVGITRSNTSDYEK